jgi:hypothetical protein
MQNKLIFLLHILIFMLIKTFIPDAGAAGGFSELPGIEGWYQVVETDQPQTWSRQLFHLYPASSKANEKKFVLAGFTDQGASVHGVCHGSQLNFSRQTVKVIPKGGDGKLEWNIDMQADGTLKGKMIELNYQIFQPNGETLKGKVVAEKTQQ